MTETPLDDYRWLTGDEGAAHLAKIADDLQGGPPSPRVIRSLRTDVGLARASLLLEQIELRAKAREKFSDADRMFFIRKGLEQATDELIAAYKGQRWAASLSAADLCCGIGGDAMQLGKAAPVALVDRDEISLFLAETNVRRSGGTVMLSAAQPVNAHHVSQVDAWHIDPDRRASGTRTSRVELGEPGIEVLNSLLEMQPSGAVKLAPATDLPGHWRSSCEREWIESRGECRQQVAWFGTLADAVGLHTATVIGASGEACSFTGDSSLQVELSQGIKRFLFDPSPALLAAQLAGASATALALLAVSSWSAYFTASEGIPHPMWQGFEVLDEMPFDLRKLRSYLRERSIGRLEIKKRGVEATPECVRKALELHGDEEATLLLMRLNTGNRAVIARRVPPAG
jgi:hypothetical protein